MKNKPTLQSLWNRIKKSEDDLSAAINELYPVGTNVVVKWGRGWLYGKVAHESHHRGCLIIQADNGGQIHHKHFSDVHHG